MANQSKKHTYLGNPNLPSTEAEFEYTPEMAKEIEKCSNNMLYFAENYFYIVDPDEGKVLIPLFDYQKRLLKSFIEHQYNCVLSSRQSGKTTVLTILALHEACFNEYKNIIIVANKEDTAKMIFKRVKLAYEALPNWLKPAVKNWGQTSMELANGSYIAISTTSGSAARGSTINCVDGSTEIEILDNEEKQRVGNISDFYNVDEELVNYNSEKRPCVEKILELVKHEFPITKIENNVNIKNYNVNYLADGKFLIEIIEKNTFFEKQKYDFLLDNGYKIIFVWCGLHKEEHNIYIEDYYNKTIQLEYKPIKNEKNFKILTDDGYQNYSKIVYQGKKDTFLLETKNKRLISTLDHVVFGKNDKQIEVKNLDVGDEIKTIDGYEKIININFYGKKQDVYDVLGSENFKFSSNGIISHQCLLLDELAWITPNSIIQEFWSSVWPTISRAKTSKVLITSTPKGKDNLFYTLYNGAEKGENSFNAEKVDWSDIPGRDEAWRKEQIANLGSIELFNQEFNCVCENTLVQINNQNDPITVEELYETM